MTQFGVVLAAFSAFVAQVPADSDRLPVKRVVLYKNGVGYFEHLGPVRGSQEVNIAFTSGQLNDVLKSLTVLDLNGGHITGVEYGSAAPVDRQLGDLRLPLGEKTSLTELLGALRGARLEVRSAGGVITGRLLSVERKTRMGSGATLEVDYVSLLTESGEVKTTEVSPSFSVKLLDRGLAGKVDRYLDVVGASREADVRQMVISTAGSGERSLFVSYISEVPVWKATYRIVLNPKRAPLLQGWAIVDNTVGQDWDKVALSLVAGAPQSFVQNLSQPYYSRRPVPLPEALAAAPQTYEATLIAGGAKIAGVILDPAGGAVSGARVRAFDAGGALISETNADAAGRYEIAGLPEGSIRLEVSRQGFQSMRVQTAAGARQDLRLQPGGTTDTVDVEAAAGLANASTSMTRTDGTHLGSGSMLGGNAAMLKKAPIAGFGSGGGYGGAAYRVDTARAQSEAAARAQELGDLFEYKLKEPITIPKNRSALVPIVQSSIAAEKVSVWNERARLPRPQRALWITNSSGLTLDGGSFSVLEDETFAGEGIFDPIRPDEKRLVSYATDLGLTVRSKADTDQQRVTRARIVNGVLILHSEIFETRTYTLRNEDTSPRIVIVEHPVRPGYELRGDPKPVETTSQWMRFRLNVAPKETASLAVSEARPVQATYQVSKITGDQIALFLKQKSIDASIEDVLRKVIAQQERIRQIEEEKEARGSEQEGIFDDQQRLRENMKALKGSVEEKALLQRYTRQLNDQEDKLDKLRKEIEDLDARQAKEQATLDKMIQDLAMDVKL